MVASDKHILGYQDNRFVSTHWRYRLSTNTIKDDLPRFLDDPLYGGIAPFVQMDNLQVIMEDTSGNQWVVDDSSDVGYYPYRSNDPASGNGAATYAGGVGGVPNWIVHTLQLAEAHTTASVLQVQTLLPLLQVQETQWVNCTV